MDDRKPFEMPTPPANIQTIIDRLDAGEDLAEWEHKKLAEWEDSHGGFGGVA